MHIFKFPTFEPWWRNVRVQIKAPRHPGAAKKQIKKNYPQPSGSINPGLIHEFTANRLRGLRNRIERSGCRFPGDFGPPRYFPIIRDSRGSDWIQGMVAPRRAVPNRGYANPDRENRRAVYPAAQVAVAPHSTIPSTLRSDPPLDPAPASSRSTQPPTGVEIPCLTETRTATPISMSTRTTWPGIDLPAVAGF